MADAIRFFFDEHIAKAVARGLRRRGVDVLTVHEAGRSGIADDEQLRFATVEKRVVVTHDEDFLTLAAYFTQRGESFAGIAFCDADKYLHLPGKLIRDLLTLHGVYTADEMMNHLEYL